MNARTMVLAVFALLLALAMPAQGHAQCTTKCGCISDGCGCQSSGGNGGKCDASGNGCFVARCPTPLQPVAFSADGGVLLSRDLKSPAEAPGATDENPVAGRRLVAADWESVAPGRAVARACNGIVIAHWYDPGAADELRRATRELAI